MYRQGVCRKGERCEFKHDPKDKVQLVMMVEQRVQEALKGLQMKPEGAIVHTSEGAHKGVLREFVEGNDENDDPHTLNMVMHVRTRAMRSSVRQNKRSDKTDEIKSLVQNAIRRQTANQGALIVHTPR